MEFEGRLEPGTIKVGTKQTIKMVEQHKASLVYVAQDADSRLTSRIVQLCKQHSVEVVYVDTMRALGKTCGIEVGTAAAVVVEE
ncbi:ribosomal L7Ae/L30e/S12e/Gadd45 family protein [Cohnella fermenti]|uniref:50S ribosomal protein L7ae-like protein n=1 Tax=Cohnella fermenti TaxID=2565925 RepID=A0A4S4C110_9BACL|nr:ribosomal L7Ae/L30e/S12e/Gadd45 family protein [Cohnella fermenti]THF79185.1 50S ribosomal protein L7ae-like protein [Cohnella fermenti]